VIWQTRLSRVVPWSSGTIIGGQGLKLPFCFFTASAIRLRLEVRQRANTKATTRSRGYVRAGNYHCCCKVFQVNGESRLDASATGNHAFALQDPLNGTQGVVYGTLHFVAVVVVGSAQNDGTRRPGFGPVGIFQVTFAALTTRYLRGFGVRGSGFGVRGSI
jgi:hypothetical protein